MGTEFLRPYTKTRGLEEQGSKVSNTAQANQLQGSLMRWLQSGRSQRIQDVVEAYPECKWSEIFEAIEALTQSRRVSFKISGSELELRAFSHRRF